MLSTIYLLLLFSEEEIIVQVLLLLLGTNCRWRYHTEFGRLLAHFFNDLFPWVRLFQHLLQSLLVNAL